MDANALDNTPSELGKVLNILLDEAKYEDACEEIDKSEHCKDIVKQAMELIPSLARRIHNHPNNLELGHCIQKLLASIAQKGKIKEVVMALLVELDSLKNDQDLLIALTPLSIAMMRQWTQNCRLSASRWIFKSVIDRLQKINLPTNHDFESKEQLLLDCDPSVITLVEALEATITFFKSFYCLLLEHEDIKFVDSQADVRTFLAKTLVHLFERPLTYLDLYCDEKIAESNSCRLASKLVCMINVLHPNPIKFLEGIVGTSKCLRDNEFDEDEDEIDSSFPHPLPSQALGCLFYCYYYAHMSHMLPCVHHPLFVFQQCLPVLCALLRVPEYLPLHKGVLLAQSLVNALGAEAVDMVSLDMPCQYEFVQLMCSVITRADKKELRIYAFEVFKKYVTILTIGARYRIFEYLLQTLDHAGLLGFTVTEIKQNIFLSLRDQTDSIKRNPFVGSAMWKLVYESCKLPDGETTDMLDYSDKILASLNLLTFLFIRASKCNFREETYTEADKQMQEKFSLLDMPYHLQHIEEEFLSPLRNGLQLSREHYEQKLKMMESGEDPGDEDHDLELYAGGGLMPGFSHDQKVQVMRLSLSRFDMINCVLAQTSAAVEQLNEAIKSAAKTTQVQAPTC
ncbi:glomulin [Hyalella azteca]|uniref:Glomulin n=1 Tax=Hyalella azteca TaxID=294128 RepID=A0A8B7NWT7_HYAAZ|nr:glomulin [Hyalella azteca]